MKILQFELKKLCSYKAFIFIVAAILVMNIVATITAVTSSSASPGEYKYIYSRIQSLSADDIDVYITNLVDTAFSGNGNLSPDVVCSIRDRYNQIKGYEEFLISIKRRCHDIIDNPFFCNDKSFAYKNAMKTATAYDNIKIKSLPFEVSEGAELVFFNDISDILLIFAMFTITVFVFTKDKEIGILNLLHTYHRGRGYLCMTKLIVVLIFSAAVNIVFMGENLAIAGSAYGLGSLTRPIQSVNGFFECSFNLNLWQYLLVMFIFKSLGAFIWGVLFSLICSFSNNIAQVYGISLFITVGEALLYAKVSVHSVYSMLHDFNLVSFIKPDNIFSTYRNINLYNEPFNVLVAIFVMWGIILALLILTVVKVYECEKNTVYRKVFINIKTKNTKYRIHNKLYYTFYKSLVLQKTGFLAVVWFAVVVIFHLSFTKPVDLSDYYYENYTTNNSGTVTTKTDNIINADEKYFSELHDELLHSDITMERIQEIQSEFSRETAFLMFKSRCEAIRDSKYDTKIFYDSGYKRAFNVNENNESIQMTLLIMMFCVLSISPLISFDRSKGFTNIIYSTASGKISYFKHSITVTVMYNIFASAVVMLPYFFNILYKYGTQGISLPVQSLEYFVDLGIPINIWQYALGLFLVRTLFFAFCSLAMLIVSKQCKSQSSATIINLILFVIPTLILVMRNTLK